MSDGSAAEFLMLVLLAPLAGLVLIINSLVGFFLYRRIESPLIGLLFIMVGVIGWVVAIDLLPQFRM